MEIRGTSIMNTSTLVLRTEKIEQNNNSVHLLVYPSGYRGQLPEGLKLTIFDENNEVFETIAADKGNWAIQYQFEAEDDDKFRVSIELGNLTKDILVSHYQNWLETEFQNWKSLTELLNNELKIPYVYEHLIETIESSSLVRNNPEQLQTI